MSDLQTMSMDGKKNDSAQSTLDANPIQSNNNETPTNIVNENDKIRKNSIIGKTWTPQDQKRLSFVV